MNESRFLKHIAKYSSIYIYGAGMVGELVYNRLLTMDMSGKVHGFVVTKRKETGQKFCGQVVHEISEIESYREDALVIIATLKGLHKEIEDILNTIGFKNIVKVSDQLYKDMVLQYVNDFKEKQGKIHKEIDVVFMASDNNSSSGAFLCMVDLNCELRKQGINTLVVLPGYGTGERLLREREISYTYIISEDWSVDDKFALNVRKRIRLLKNKKAIKELHELICDCRVKLIHNNTTYTYVGAYAARKENIALIWHIREYMKFQNKRFLSKNWAIKTMNCSDEVIYISEYMRDCLKSVNAKSSVIIYDGLDVDTFFIPNKEILEKEKVVITLVGALVSHKRQEDLIRAAAVLKQRGGRAFTIRFVGNGKSEYERYLSKLVDEFDLDDCIEFLGRRDNMRAVYEETDIAIVCSGIEGFGRVTVEGQLAGCLVIAANSGATVELIKDGETGILYETGDSMALTNCICEAIAQFDRSKKIASQGQIYACQNYSREKNAVEIINLYKKYLGEKVYEA